MDWCKIVEDWTIFHRHISIYDHLDLCRWSYFWTLYVVLHGKTDLGLERWYSWSQFVASSSVCWHGVEAIEPAISFAGHNQCTTTGQFCEENTWMQFNYTFPHSDLWQWCPLKLMAHSRKNLCFLVIWGGRGFSERLNNFVFFGFNQFWDDPLALLPA
jgi:hypothetical protein